MSFKEIEQKVIDLKHRDPFAPFVFEMDDGRCVEVSDPGLAINQTGAGFFGPDGGIVDIEFKNVRAVRLLAEAAA